MKKVECIVPVSGGKDSQACLKLAVEEFGSESVMGLFCDTQFEHDKTYDHVQYMSKLYNVEIYILNEGESVKSRCIKRGRFPGGGARHCTNELKIQPTKRFLKRYAEMFGPVEVWYGMRIDESVERSKRYQYKDPDSLYPPHEVIGNYPKYLEKLGVMYRLPIVDWYEKEVFDELGGKHNPLYDEGFVRVGCFPCLAGGDKWKIKAFEHDSVGARHLIQVREIETVTGKSVFTSGIGQRWDDDNQGCAICNI